MRGSAPSQPGGRAAGPILGGTGRGAASTARVPAPAGVHHRAAEQLPARLGLSPLFSPSFLFSSDMSLCKAGGWRGMWGIKCCFPAAGRRTSPCPVLRITGWFGVEGTLKLIQSEFFSTCFLCSICLVVSGSSVQPPGEG